MSTVGAVKELKRLSYTDMKELATQLTTQLHIQCESGRQLSVLDVAEALAKLPEGSSELALATDKLLKKAFSSRQKTIRCAPSSTGWTVEFGKYQAAGADLPAAINQLLDQIAAMQALGVK